MHRARGRFLLSAPHSIRNEANPAVRSERAAKGRRVSREESERARTSKGISIARSGANNHVAIKGHLNITIDPLVRSLPFNAYYAPSARTFGGRRSICALIVFKICYDNLRRTLRQRRVCAHTASLPQISFDFRKRLKFTKLAVLWPLVYMLSYLNISTSFAI